MKFSIVVITYNSLAFLKKCLDSVMPQMNAETEIIVVDNGSTDGTEGFLKALSLKVKVLVNSSNRGASAARNQGIAMSRGEWVLTLDADAALNRDFLSQFDKFLALRKTEEKIGIVVPKILYPDEKTIYSLGHQLTLLRRFKDVGHGKRDMAEDLNNKDIFGACAATAFYNRRMLDDIGLRGEYFDEAIFFMAEDVDLAWRARKKGWRVVSCYSCVSTHAGNSMRLNELQKRFYEIRNRFLIMLKNDSIFYLLFLAFPLFIYEVVRFIKLSLKGQGKMYVDAVVSAWKLKGAL